MVPIKPWVPLPNLPLLQLEKQPMAGTPPHYILISDFNLETLARILRNSTAQSASNVVVAPYGQVFQSLVGLHQPADPASAAQNIAILWTQPQSLIKAYADAASFAPYDKDTAWSEVDAFADVVVRAARSLRALFISRWTVPHTERGLGPLAYKPEIGARLLLDQMNARLAERLSEQPNVFFLDPDRWISEAGGDSAWNPVLWYAAKSPFTAKVFQSACNDITSYSSALEGRTKKLIILDLDDTLWGGVVGETGWQGLTLGGHSHAGEAFQDFQRALKALTRRGILLALCSKNDEAVALEAIDNHPEMILHRDDFASWKINWRDKASNISALLEEINLSPEATLFIDDNPSERGLVSDALPQVTVPDWPKNPSLYTSTLKSLDCFDTVTVSDEDRQRVGSYAAERKRRDMLTSGTEETTSDWIERLEITVAVEQLSVTNLTRTTQLFNKTNQMNLTTRRMTESELTAWASKPNRHLWTFRVSDRFGDYGLTGIISGEHIHDTVTITDFILSCRVMGRKVEAAMVHHVYEWAKAQGAKHLEAHFEPTDRNRPCLDFWNASGFDEVGAHHFRWSLITPYKAPSALTLKWQVAA